MLKARQIQILPLLRFSCVTLVFSHFSLSVGSSWKMMAHTTGLTEESLVEGLLTEALAALKGPTRDGEVLRD